MAGIAILIFKLFKPFKLFFKFFFLPRLSDTYKQQKTGFCIFRLTAKVVLTFILLNFWIESEMFFMTS